MNWTQQQLDEALEHIEATHKSMTAMQQAVEEMKSSLKCMIEAFDRMSAQILKSTYLDSPPICPSLNS